MTLLRDIQNSAIDSDVSISTILRKCKVLSVRLGSSEFKRWVECELNGYKDTAELPNYRILAVQSKGSFIGSIRAAENVPIPLSSMPKEFRDDLSNAFCAQPISAYEALVQSSPMENCQQDWNSDLIAHFGNNIYQGMTCIAAWKDISYPSIIALIDTVRNMILNFVLEIEVEAPDAGEAELNSPKIPTEQVTQIFNTTVNGNVGNLAEGNTNVHQTSTLNIQTNDIDSLREALENMKLPSDEIEILEHAIEDDNSREVVENRKLGSRVSAWLGSLLEKSVQGIDSVINGVTISLITKAIFQYYGI